jgi:ABC-type bacteriocin/lantibiotic exporter with double-glycine peptidase domain
MVERAKNSEVKIIRFPQIRQAYEYDCGAEALRGVLVFHGLDIKKEFILELANTDTETGTLVDNMLKALRKYRIKCKAQVFSIKSLKESINNGCPVILLIQAWLVSSNKINWKDSWLCGHYVVAIGYDKDNIYFADPYSAFRTYLSYEELESRWRHRDPMGNEYVNFGIAIPRPKKPFNPDKAIHMD